MPTAIAAAPSLNLIYSRVIPSLSVFILKSASATKFFGNRISNTAPLNPSPYVSVNVNCPLKSVRQPGPLLGIVIALPSLLNIISLGKEPLGFSQKAIPSQSIEEKVV